MATRQEIYAEIETEREAQVFEYGGPDKDDEKNERDWVGLVVKFLGRVIEAKSPQAMRRSFVRVAALAVAACEWHDRMMARLERAGR